MIETLADGGRIVIKGFGAFTLRPRSAMKGRNPRTGEIVEVPQKFGVHFKPGKELRERVDASRRASSNKSLSSIT